MTRLTLRGYACRGMIRILCFVVIFRMTNVALCWRSRVTRSMTGTAFSGNMCSQQRKRSVVVVEGGFFPIVCIVALQTVGRVLLRNMLGCFVVVGLMTGHTFRTGTRGVSLVAFRTLLSRMSSRKSKTRGNGVIKL